VQAAQASQAGLVENLQGMWCDAVVVLVGWEWPHARQAIWQPRTASTAAAVQTWLQVCSSPGTCAVWLQHCLQPLVLLLLMMGAGPLDAFCSQCVSVALLAAMHPLLNTVSNRQLLKPLLHDVKPIGLRQMLYSPWELSAMHCFFCCSRQCLAGIQRQVAAVLLLPVKLEAMPAD